MAAAAAATAKKAEPSGDVAGTDAVREAATDGRCWSENRTLVVPAGAL